MIVSCCGHGFADFSEPMKFFSIDAVIFNSEIFRTPGIHEDAILEGELFRYIIRGR